MWVKIQKTEKGVSKMKICQVLYKTCWRDIKKLDDVSDALQREREREDVENLSQGYLNQSIEMYLETSISDDLEEMIKLTKKQELFRIKYGIASNASLFYAERLLKT